MSDALMERARAFFDKKRGLRGESDPELSRALKRMERQVGTARKDGDFKNSLIRTLAVLERDMKVRQDRLAEKLVADARKSGQRLSSDDLAAAVTRNIPRELRYLQASGLSLVQSLNSNTKMSERELRKFSDRSSKFASAIEDLRTEGPKGKSYAQTSEAGGLSLTDRLRQYQEGKLLDGKRHSELLEKLDDTAERRDKDDSDSKKGDMAKKLGLTAFFGPAAPLFQLWYDAKEELQELRKDGRDLLDKTKQKFKWDQDKEIGDERLERKQTSLFERLLKAMKLQEIGRQARGLKGWLFGGDEGPDIDVDLDRNRRDPRRSRRMSRNRGRSLGRTAGRMGRGILGGARSVGRGIASVARPAWSALSGLGSSAAGFGARTLGGIAAGGAGALAGAGAAVAGAGYLGYQVGNAINDHLLTDEQKEAIGKLIYDSVQGVGNAVEAAGTAISTAGSRISSFFKNAGSETVADITYLRQGFVKKVGAANDYMVERLTTASDTIGKWSEEAKDRLKDFWDTLRGGASGALSFVRAVAGRAREAAAPAVAAAGSAMQGAVSGAQRVGRRAADFLQGESRGLGVGRYNEDEQASIQAARAGGDKFRGGQGITQEHRQMIMEVAKQQGINPEHMLAMVQMESGGNPNAVSATGASGLLQFTGGTGRQMGVNNRFDPRQNLEGGGRLMTANAERLRKAGIEPTLENLYLAHQQGAGGAIQILNAAQGRGQISDDVRRNMGLNYGEMDPSSYLAQNKRKIENARVAATTGPGYSGTYARATGPDGKPLATPSGATAVAAAAGAPGTSGTGRGVRKDMPVTVASATPPSTGGFKRVSPQAPWMPPEPIKKDPVAPTTTSSAARMGMEKNDFYVDDLGLILVNRGAFA